MSSIGSGGCITVLAGVNGSGKSSLMGKLLTDRNAQYFNPDRFARQLRELDKSLSQGEANAMAWNYGRDQLEQTIGRQGDFTFETTLGANTIPRLLKAAAEKGLDVRMWYCGLATPELNIRRVAARVRDGGHDIPEVKIRERWDSSRANLVSLLPFLSELRVFDNSAEATPENGFRPAPVLLLHLKAGKILVREDAPPDWAKPIIAAALLHFGSG
jgi:predicted ABC-type ATPase